MIKAILFDLDGTIGDTLPLCISAFKKSIEHLIGRIEKNFFIMRNVIILH